MPVNFDLRMHALTHARVQGRAPAVMRLTMR